MNYVTDTHPFIWYLCDDKRLSDKANEVFQEAESGKAIIIVPTIVLAEILFICEKRRIFMKFQDILERMERTEYVQEFPLNMAVIKESQHQSSMLELHDRIIVATAKLLNAKLITKDSEIHSLSHIRLVW